MVKTKVRTVNRVLMGREFSSKTGFRTFCIGFKVHLAYFKLDGTPEDLRIIEPCDGSCRQRLIAMPTVHYSEILQFLADGIPRDRVHNPGNKLLPT